MVSIKLAPPAAALEKEEKGFFGDTPNPGRGLQPSALPLNRAGSQARISQRHPRLTARQTVNDPSGPGDTPRKRRHSTGDPAQPGW